MVTIQKTISLLVLSLIVVSGLSYPSSYAATLTLTDLAAGPHVVDFRDIGITISDFTPAISLDDTRYQKNQIATLTIVDHNANVDLTNAETITSTVGSTNILLTETGINTGTFTGTFIPYITGVDVNYDPANPKEVARARIGFTLSTPGNVTISDVVFDSSGIGGCPKSPAIHGFNIVANSTALLGGTVDSVILSYANAAMLGQDQYDLQMFYQSDPLLQYDFVALSVIGVYEDAIDTLGLTITTDPTILTNSGSSVLSLNEGNYTLGFDGGCPGGGGGGVSTAGIVVQAIGAISIFNGAGVSATGVSGPPSFDDSSFTLSPGFGGSLSDDQLSDGTTSKLEVGKKSDISMGFKMPGGLNDLDHIGLYANIGSGQDKYDADTYIYFDKYKDPQITIHDPHGFFKSVNIDVTEPTKSNIDVNFVFDFAKSLDNSNVVFEAWNLKRESALKEIPDLLMVDDPTKQEVTPETTETITPTTQERPPVPEWVKSNAAWWGKGEIDDNEFTNGIGYLIQNQIIDVPELLQPNVSPEKIENPDTGLIEPQEEFTPVVPDWVKNNAVWWSEGHLTDDDFLMGIKYLLEKGIIQVKV